MATFKRKTTKIRLLCERAERYEQEREALEEHGFNDEEAEQILREREEQRTQPTITKPPFDEREHVVRTLDMLHGGLSGTHQVKSATKTMMEDIDRKFQKTKARKLAQTQGAEPLVSMKDTAQSNYPIDPTATQGLDEQKILDGLKTANKGKKKEIQQMQDAQIKKQNYRDHLTEMFSGLDAVTKTNASEMKSNFVYDANMEKETLERNFDHHLKQNDLKWYNEAYIKHKSTMRK